MAGHSRRSSLASIFLALVIGGSSNAPARGQDVLPKIKFQLATAPSPSDAPYYLARELNLYAQDGVDVEFVPGRSSQDAVNAIVTGKATVAATLGANLILSAGRGQRVVSIGGRYSGELQGVTAAVDSGIMSLKDITNRQVFVSASGFQVILTALLKRLGVDASSNRYILIPEPHVMVTTYLGGKGEAMTNNIPYAQSIIGSGRPSRHFTFEDFGDPEPGYIFVASPETVRTQPDALRRFLHATYLAHKIANQDPDMALAILAKAQPGLDVTGGKTMLGAYQAFACSHAGKGHPRGWHPPSDWRVAAEFYQQVGLIDQALDSSTLFTNQFFDGPNSVAVENCEG